MPPVTFQDIAASLVALILVTGLVYLAAVGETIPASLAMALGSATTWLFVRVAVKEQVNNATNVATRQGAANDAYYGFGTHEDHPKDPP